MKKIITFLFGAALITVNAQTPFPCGTDEAMKKEFQLHPELYQQYLEREAALAQEDAIAFQNGYGSNVKLNSMPPVYTIPVVFHILHQYGPENISDAQVYDQMTILNNDYRKLNADISNVVAGFQSIAADVEVQFALATIDPNGNCTNGIVRHVDANTNWPNSASAYAYTWPRSKYLNIYVVKTISSGAAGYTYLPGSTGASSDAIVILNGYVGSIGTGNTTTSRALTHEVGHWLNLQHVWGSTNNPGVSCGNDGVTDTPVTKGYYSTCPLTNCDICNAGVDENVQNYMEYSYCSNMFTTGQKTRMRTALTSSTASRNNLWTTANLAATGVSPLGSVCTPVADFDNSTNYACTNTNVTYYDLSWNGQPTSWSWSFPGGNPSTSTDSIPVVQYPTAGVYSASFTVTNAAGSNSVTKTNIITVSNATATYQSGWQESFETSAIPNSDWTINNLTGGVTWTRTSNAAVTGTYCMYLQNTSNTGLGTDEAISPSMNVSGLTSPTFSFKVAHAQKNSSQLDNLKLYSSTNCGQTWSQKYNKSGSSLQTLGTGIYQSAAFTPTAAQWRQENININNLLFSGNVMFKFVFICDSTTSGNNIYIDDINLNFGGVGMEENVLDNTLNFFVAPNPSNGQTSINFNLIEKMPVKIEITDMLGRKVETLANSNYEAGEYRINIGEKANYSSGIYFVNLKVGEKTYSKKMLIE
ncbi:MAG: T9SS type A sorting domain-containing protein [Bacteroidia bacterium]|nr:T9SS type A sorting domain-containing protein [Bacteroidia bacterium]